MNSNLQSIEQFLTTVILHKYLTSIIIDEYNRQVNSNKCETE